jgi:tetrahydromethanopterin S-methyltransferase subunit B
MISEDALGYLLEATAEQIPLPGAGPARILAAAGPPRRRPSLPRARWLAAAGLGVLAASGAGLAASGGLAGSGGPASSRTLAGSGGLGGGHGLAAPGVPFGSAAGSASSGSAIAGPTGQPSAVAGPSSSALGPRQAAVLPTLTQRVVQTGAEVLTVPADRVAATLGRVQTAAGALGGYVQDSSSVETGPDPSGTLTVRVPVANFDTLVNEVQGFGRVISVQESGQNVTSSYVDLGAQIAALEVSRSTYLSILAKATTIGDILAVQQQVDSVTQQIDELQGERNVLADQAADSTLTVNVATPAGAATHPPSGLRRAFDSAVHGFVVGFEDILAALGPLLLILGCLAGLALIGRFAWRVTRRQLV